MKMFKIAVVLILAMLPMAFADESSTGQFSVQNSVPEVNAVQVFTDETNIISDATNPTNVGQTLRFNVEWHDQNGDSVRIFVCKAQDATVSGCGAAGEWASSATEISSTPEELYYSVTNNENEQVYDAYVYASDGTGLSSPVSTTFEINHRPNAYNVAISPSNAYTDSTLTCNYQFNDSDSGDSENTGSVEYKWWLKNEGTGGYTEISGETAATLDSSHFDEADNVRCGVKVMDNHGFPDNNYVQAPEIQILNSVPKDLSSSSDADSQCSKNVGETITFSADYTDIDQQDTESEPVGIYVCRSSPCTTSSTDLMGNCNGAQTTGDGSTVECNYNAQATDEDSFNVYVSVCDDNNECAEETLNVYVNHPPEISGTPDVTPDNPNANTVLTCDYSWQDSDAGSSESGTSFEWYRDQGSGYQLQPSYTSQTLPVEATTKGDVWRCRVTPQDQCGLSGVPKYSTNETIINLAPYQPSKYMVRDGQNHWDTVSYDTHDKTADLNWTVRDYDGDAVSTHICIADSQGNLNAGNCVYSTSTGNSYVNNVAGLTFNGSSETYYVRLTPFDGSENGTYLDTNLTLINSIPAQPSNLAPQNYHTQTPEFTWDVFDADDGSVDHWPADTLTHHIRVGNTCGQGEYHSSDSANPSGEVSNTIEWGSPGEAWANRSVCVTLWTTDSHIGGVSDNYTANTVLYDHLPDITNVEMANDGAIYNSCTSGTCTLTPVIHSNTSVAVKVTAEDTDQDCDVPGVSEAYVHLCLVNGTDQCNEGNNDEYVWELDHVNRDGTTCTYWLSSNKTPTDSTPQFFRQAADDYKMHVNVTSQAGERTTDSEQDAQWVYAELVGIDYPGLVQLGDDNINLGKWNNGTSKATMVNWGNVPLGIEWNSSNPSSGQQTWNLTGNSMQIDDDAIYNGGESSGAIAPVFIDNSLRTFEPAQGLLPCVSSGCSSEDANMDTHYHIKPPVGLAAGTYNSTITIVLTKH